ncbi:hypothetical protein CP533_4392 [Ophiocordyceps camponoti-saundersi (nom. inval.)]|nr:hypothetical protein CP533_4392 [Ophiocordyceps camponoti-saundersi (nom. inval.)]
MSGEFSAFFYGTLMAPEIFFSVCYGLESPPQLIRDIHTFTPAILDGYCRHRIRSADYPAVVPETGRSVRGIYVTGLTDANIHKLDRFEGEEYERVEVDVQLREMRGDEEVAGEMRKTFVYVFLQREDLEMGEWDFEAFRREKMAEWTRQRWGDVDGRSTTTTI